MSASTVSWLDRRLDVSDPPPKSDWLGRSDSALNIIWKFLAAIASIGIITWSVANYKANSDNSLASINAHVNALDNQVQQYKVAQDKMQADLLNKIDLNQREILNKIDAIPRPSDIDRMQTQLDDQEKRLRENEGALRALCGASNTKTRCYN